jgi:hypothetical protein
LVTPVPEISCATSPRSVALNRVATLETTGEMRVPRLPSPLSVYSAAEKRYAAGHPVVVTQAGVRLVAPLGRIRHALAPAQPSPLPDSTGYDSEHAIPAVASILRRPSSLVNRVGPRKRPPQLADDAALTSSVTGRKIDSAAWI